MLNKALCISNTRKIRRAPRIQLSGVGRTLSTLGISWCCAEAGRSPKNGSLHSRHGTADSYSESFSGIRRPRIRLCLIQSRDSLRYLAYSINSRYQLNVGYMIPPPIGACHITIDKAIAPPSCPSWHIHQSFLVLQAETRLRSEILCAHHPSLPRISLMHFHLPHVPHVQSFSNIVDQVRDVMKHYKHEKESEAHQV